MNTPMIQWSMCLFTFLLDNATNPTDTTLGVSGEEQSVSPNYCMSPTHHTFLSLIRWSQHVWYKSVYMCVRERELVKKKWWHTVLELSIFPGGCGHLTAGWGGRWGLNFPGVSLSPNRATYSVSKEERYLSFLLCLLAVILVHNFLCFTFCVYFCSEMFT